jgi:hypothetical protein
MYGQISAARRSMSVCSKDAFSSISDRDTAGPCYPSRRYRRDRTVDNLTIRPHQSSLYERRYSEDTTTIALALFRRNVSDRSRELCMRRRIKRSVPDLGACRILAEEVVVPPVLCRPDRPRDKPAAAIWADVIQHFFHARCTERTFIRANPRLD